MDIEELEVSNRAYTVLKGAAIDTVEDLCLLTGEQLMRLGNFGKKSLDEVRLALEQHSLSLHPGPADSRLLVSSVKVRPRFNIGLSVARRDRESLAGYTVREISEIAERLEQVRSRVGGRTRNQLWSAIGHLGMLRQVHETILAGGDSEVSKPQEQ
jgi:hypothetical protein